MGIGAILGGVGAAAGGAGRAMDVLRDDRYRQAYLDRLAKEDEYRRKLDDRNWRLGLLSAGGGVGEAPAFKPDLGLPEPDFPDRALPEPGPGVPSGLGLSAGATGRPSGVGMAEPKRSMVSREMGLAPVPEPVDIGAPEPPDYSILYRAKMDPNFGRFRQFGEGPDAFYIEAPDWRERKAAEAQAAASAAEVAGRRERIGRLGHISPDSADVLAHGDLPASFAIQEPEEPDEFAGAPRFPNTPEGRQQRIQYEAELAAARREPDDDRAAREDMILVGGRYFPNTPEGQEQAIAWQKQLGAARGTGGDNPFRRNLPPGTTPPGDGGGPPPSDATIPEWFRAQHAKDMEAGLTDVPADINEAWEKWRTGGGAGG